MAPAAVASGPSSDVAARAAQSLTSRQQAATRRLLIAARDFRRAINTVERGAGWLFETLGVMAELARFVGAIDHARAVGLTDLAERYRRVLDSEIRRLKDAQAFHELLRRANAYGEKVAQKAHEDNPRLSPAVLGNIAFNAASWYGNDVLLKVTLRAAKRKSPVVYEIAYKKGDDLDRRAYDLYRALSVGSRKTARKYGGREGLHELPDAKGGFGGGFIGLRRAAETSSGKSPAIDIQMANGKYVKIHLRHGP